MKNTVVKEGRESKIVWHSFDVCDEETYPPEEGSFLVVTGDIRTGEQKIANAYWCHNDEDSDNEYSFLDDYDNDLIDSVDYWAYEILMP